MSNQPKYDVEAWQKYADAFMAAIRSQQPQVVIMATYTEDVTEFGDAAGDVIVHAEGFPGALRRVIGALNSAYGGSPAVNCNDVDMMGCEPIPLH